MVADALSRRLLANTISGMKNSLIEDIQSYSVDDDFLKFLYKGFSKKAKMDEEIENDKSL